MRKAQVGKVKNFICHISAAHFERLMAKHELFVGDAGRAREPSYYSELRAVLADDLVIARVVRGK